MAESVLGPVIYSLSYCRWYLEGLFEKEAIRYPEVMARYVHGLSTKNVYTLDNCNSCVAVLFAMRLAYRVLALLFMLLTNGGSNISCILLLEKSGGKRIIIKVKRGFKLHNRI